VCCDWFTSFLILCVLILKDESNPPTHDPTKNKKEQRVRLSVSVCLSFKFSGRGASIFVVSRRGFNHHRAPPLRAHTVLFCVCFVLCLVCFGVPYAGFAFCVALSVFVFVSRLFCVLDRLVGRGRSTVWWCAVIGPRIVISWFVVLSLARSALLLTHPFVSWDFG